MFVLTKPIAKRMIHCLKGSGQAANAGVSHLFAGFERVREYLSTEVIGDILQPFAGGDGMGAIYFVIGNYGETKTTFLRMMKEVLWAAGYPVAMFDLDTQGVRADRMEDICRATMKSIEPAPTDVHKIGMRTGLDYTIEVLVDKKFPGVLSDLDVDESLVQDARHWIRNTLRHTPVDMIVLRDVAVKYLEACLDGREDVKAVAQRYLQGDVVSRKDLDILEVGDRLDKRNALYFMMAIPQLLTRSELAPGVGTLMDEAKRSISHMTPNMKAQANENLVTLINKTNDGKFPGTLLMIAVMPDFFSNFAKDYPALIGRCGKSARISLGNLPGSEERELLLKIGKNITNMFNMAYDECVLDSHELDKVMPSFVKQAYKFTLGDQTRRLFARSWTEYLDECRENKGVKAMDDEAVRVFVEASNFELQGMDGEETIEAESST